jgi:hypothetical protein
MIDELRDLIDNPPAGLEAVSFQLRQTAASLSRVDMQLQAARSQVRMLEVQRAKIQGGVDALRYALETARNASQPTTAVGGGNGADASSKPGSEQLRSGNDTITAKEQGNGTGEALETLLDRGDDQDEPAVASETEPSGVEETPRRGPCPVPDLA